MERLIAHHRMLSHQNDAIRRAVQSSPGYESRPGYVSAPVYSGIQSPAEESRTEPVEVRKPRNLRIVWVMLPITAGCFISGFFCQEMLIVAAFGFLASFSATLHWLCDTETVQIPSNKK